jgi:plasmid stabilization system protein ParE
MVGKIDWTETALLKFEETIHYYNIRNSNDLYSKSLHDEITKSERRLLNNPFIGIAIAYTNYRKILVSYYSIFYKIQDSKITIVLFWDNRRKPRIIRKRIGKNFINFYTILNLQSQCPFHYLTQSPRGF